MGNNQDLNKDNIIAALLNFAGNDVDSAEYLELLQELESMINYKPRVGILGKTGVGKSSLCNLIFGQDVCKVSDVTAGTTKQQIIDLGKMTLIDLPGIGENPQKDAEYRELYKNIIPQLDLIIWVFKADDRALQSEIDAWKQTVLPIIINPETSKNGNVSFADLRVPFLAVINQTDKLGRGKWNQNIPDETVLQNIKEKKELITREFKIPESKIIPISVELKYNISKLIKEIIFNVPREKKAGFYFHTKSENMNDADKEATKEEVKKGIIGRLKDKFSRFWNDHKDTILDGVKFLWDNKKEIIVLIETLKTKFGKTKI